MQEVRTSATALLSGSWLVSELQVASERKQPLGLKSKHAGFCRFDWVQNYYMSILVQKNHERSLVSGVPLHPCLRSELAFSPTASASRMASFNFTPLSSSLRTLSFSFPSNLLSLTYTTLSPHHLLCVSSSSGTNGCLCAAALSKTSRLVSIISASSEPPSPLPDKLAPW